MKIYIISRMRHYLETDERYPWAEAHKTRFGAWRAAVEDMLEYLTVSDPEGDEPEYPYARRLRDAVRDGGECHDALMHDGSSVTTYDIFEQEI